MAFASLVERRLRPGTDLSNREALIDLDIEPLSLVGDEGDSGREPTTRCGFSTSGVEPPGKGGNGFSSGRGNFPSRSPPLFVVGGEVRGLLIIAWKLSPVLTDSGSLFCLLSTGFLVGIDSGFGTIDTDADGSLRLASILSFFLEDCWDGDDSLVADAELEWPSL